MNTDIAKIEDEINKLIEHCCDKAFRNKASLAALRSVFEQLRDIRQDLLLGYENFPKNNSVDIIIQDIQKAIDSTIEKEKLEWTYDHYIDLFKFEAEQLHRDIALNIKTALSFRRDWN